MISRLRARGIIISAQHWDPFDLSSNAFATLLHVRMTVQNLWNLSFIASAKSVLRLGRTSRTTSVTDRPQAAINPASVENRVLGTSSSVLDDHEEEARLSWLYTEEHDQGVLPSLVLIADAELKSTTGGASTPNTSPRRLSTLASGRRATSQATQSQGTATTIPQGQSSQVSPPQVASSGNPSTVNIPPHDFVLLCFQVKKYLVRRHDVSMLHISQDGGLFKAFREAYTKNFSWAHRTFSIWSVADIKFVKVRQQLITKLPIAHSDIQN